MKQTNHVLNQQKAVSNPFLKTTQPTANTTAQQEYMNSCKEGKCQNSYLSGTACKPLYKARVFMWS